MNDKSDDKTKAVTQTVSNAKLPGVEAKIPAVEPAAPAVPAQSVPLKAKPTTPVVPMDRVRPAPSLVAPKPAVPMTGPLANPPPAVPAKPTAAVAKPPVVAAPPAKKPASVKKRPQTIAAKPVPVIEAKPTPAPVAAVAKPEALEPVAEKKITTAAPALAAPKKVPARAPVRKAAAPQRIATPAAALPEKATKAVAAPAPGSRPGPARKPSAPAPELPETFARAATAGLDRSRETFEMMRGSAERVAAGLESGAETASRGLHEMRERMIEAWREQAEATLDFIRAAGSVRSVSEAVELNAVHARRRFETASAGFRDIAGVAGRTLTETGETVRKAMTEGLSLRR